MVSIFTDYQTPNTDFSDRLLEGTRLKLTDTGANVATIVNKLEAIAAG